MTFQTLIVDDDPIFVMMMKKQLQINSLFSNLNTFSNGLLALNHLKEEYSPEDRYVVFLDINMPVMDGWEFLDSLQKFAQPKNTLVFIVSSSINPADSEASAKNPFVVNHLVKPILRDTLKEVQSTIAEKLGE